MLCGQDGTGPTGERWAESIRSLCHVMQRRMQYLVRCILFVAVHAIVTCCMRCLLCRPLHVSCLYVVCCIYRALPARSASGASGSSSVFCRVQSPSCTVPAAAVRPCTCARPDLISTRNGARARVGSADTVSLQPLDPRVATGHRTVLRCESQYTMSVRSSQ